MTDIKTTSISDLRSDMIVLSQLRRHVRENCTEFITAEYAGTLKRIDAASELIERELFNRVAEKYQIGASSQGAS